MPEAQPEYADSPLLEEKATQAIVEVVRMDPENPKHVEAAHRLDVESAREGMQDETGKPETLTKNEFHNWIHSKGYWHSLYLGSTEGHPLSMFGNTYELDDDLYQQLIQDGHLSQGQKGEELATFVPPDLENDWRLSMSLTRQVVASRFAGDPTLEYIVEFITHEDGQLDQGEAQSLIDLGFKQASTVKYSDGEEDDSTAFIIRREALVP